MSTKNLARLAAALVLALVGSLGASTSAAAAPIDPDRTGSLTIHKYMIPEGYGIEAGRPGAGIRFTIARALDVDLTTNEGWRLASEMVSGDAEDVTLGSPRSEVTDGDGEAVFTGLEPGLYRVEEPEVPDGVGPVGPFYVTVPMTDPEQRDTWLYDVHVFPKNSIPPGPCEEGLVPLVAEAGVAYALQYDGELYAAPGTFECHPASAPTPPPTPTPSPSPSPSESPSPSSSAVPADDDADGSGTGGSGTGGGGGELRGGPGANAAVNRLTPGITGSETGRYTAIAMSLMAAGAVLALVVVRVKRREEA